MSSLLSDEALAQMELNERTECELLIVSNGMDCGKLAALIVCYPCPTISCV